MGNIISDVSEWLNETLFDQDNLEFDTDNLRTQAANIKKIIRDFRKQQRALTTSLDNLRDTWKTGASREFFNKYDTKWSQQLEYYFDLLDTLVSDLYYAAEHYERVKA